jgi:hypothetical protein
MFESCISNLAMLSSLLESKEVKESYTTPIYSLSQSTIGQHTRHIIELYNCLLSGYETGFINYDSRKRDKNVEINPGFAIDNLYRISSILKKPDKHIWISHSLHGKETDLGSTYFRELYYNLEHCIHHQALIKVALIELKIHSVSEEFGVAASTIKYKKECAQ